MKRSGKWRSCRAAELSSPLILISSPSSMLAPREL